MGNSLLSGIIDRTMVGVGKALELTWRRQEAITSNIVNAETPGYRAVELNFASELQRAFGEAPKNPLAKTDARHMDTSSNTSAHLIADYSGATKPDGNNVDIDIQMGRMAQNSANYSLAATMMRKKLTMLRNAIRDAGR